jgi:fumarylacetoacetase
MPLMTSWVESANSADSHFPLNNLPYGVFSTDEQEARCGVAIGDMILDMQAVEKAGLVSLGEDAVFDVPYWNDVMELGPEAWSALRARLTQLLAETADEQAQLAPLLTPMAQAQLHLPFAVNEFTDFYAGKHHATNVGTMFRGPENALPPNWLHIPIGYNGRGITTGTLFGQAFADLLTGMDRADLPLPITPVAAARGAAVTSRLYQAAFTANQLWRSL